LQYGLAQIASWLFRVSGTPAVCNGIVLELPAGLILRVAPECSGLNSTLALFVTSLLASHLFLHTLVSRALLSVFVIPLAILRNGFRIFVIGQLCVHIGPEMITSDIHRHGGPVFFVLSLIPLFAVLVFLRKANPQENAGRLSIHV
jgi:exosortase/archaeosortase family protein